MIFKAESSFNSQICHSKISSSLGKHGCHELYPRVYVQTPVAADNLIKICRISPQKKRMVRPIFFKKNTFVTKFIEKVMFKLNFDKLNSFKTNLANFSF